MEKIGVAFFLALFLTLVLSILVGNGLFTWLQKLSAAIQAKQLS